MYIVNNVEEIDTVIKNLQNNVDPLKETRLDLIEKFYTCYTPLESIAEIINKNYFTEVDSLKSS